MLFRSRICPKYLVYEVLAGSRIERETYLKTQVAALKAWISPRQDDILTKEKENVRKGSRD